MEPSETAPPLINNPLWFKDLEYQYTSRSVHPEGLSYGLKLEVPFDIIARLPVQHDDGSGGLPDALDSFNRKYIWYVVPLEVYTPSGYLINPAAAAPGSTGGFPLREDLYYGSPVHSIHEQELPVDALSPFFRFEAIKRVVAGKYYCLRRREKKPANYDVSDRRNLIGVASFEVIVTNTHQEFYTSEGASIMISAPLTEDVLDDMPVKYKWSIYRHPSLADEQLVIRRLLEDLSAIRKAIVSGTVNPFDLYLRIPAQSTRVSLVLMGLSLTETGEASRPAVLPPLPTYNRLVDIFNRIKEGFEPFLATASGIDADFFYQQLLEDVVRLYTESKIISHLSASTSARVISLKRVVPMAHRGLFRCFRLVDTDNNSVRDKIPGLEDGYGYGWIQLATIQVQVVDTQPGNAKSPEQRGVTYSPFETTLPSLTIIDTPSDGKISLALKDIASRYAHGEEAAVSWHIEVIPTVGKPKDTPPLIALPPANERGLDQERSFVSNVLQALNALETDRRSGRYLMGHKIIYTTPEQRAAGLASNTKETFQGDFDSNSIKEIFLEFFNDIIGASLNDIERVANLPILARSFRSAFPGCTVVISAFLENTSGSGVPSPVNDPFLQQDPLSRERGLLRTEVQATVVNRLIAPALASKGVGRDLIKGLLAYAKDRFANKEAELAGYSSEILFHPDNAEGYSLQELPDLGPVQEDDSETVQEFKRLVKLARDIQKELDNVYSPFSESAQLVSTIYDLIAQSGVYEYKLQNLCYSTSEKPLLGMFAFQVGMERPTALARIQQPISEAIVEEEEGLVQDTLYAYNVLSSSPLYHKNIRDLITNRMVAARYADSLIKRASNLDQRTSTYAKEQFLYYKLVEERHENTRDVQRDLHLVPLSYGDRSGPLNSEGLDAAWTRRGTGKPNISRVIQIRPMALGEGVHVFENNVTLSKVSPDGARWIISCFRQYSKFVTGKKVPREATENDVVDFLMARKSNSVAYRGLVSVISGGLQRKFEQEKLKDMRVLIESLPDVLAIIDSSGQDLNSISLMELAVLLETTEVENDTFSAKRYRRQLASSLKTRLARLASVLNRSGFRPASDTIGYNLSVNSLRSSEYTADEMRERETIKMLSFDAQKYISNANLSAIEATLSRLLQQRGGDSEVDSKFLTTFFDIPAPPKEVTQTEDAPKLNFFEGAAYMGDRGFAPRIPLREADDFASDAEEDDSSSVFSDLDREDESVGPSPPPSPPGGVRPKLPPTLPVDEMDSDEDDLGFGPTKKIPVVPTPIPKSTPKQQQKPTPKPPAPVDPDFERSLDELIGKFQSLLIRKDKRVGIARVENPVESYIERERAQAEQKRTSPIPQPQQKPDSPPPIPPQVASKVTFDQADLEDAIRRSVEAARKRLGTNFGIIDKNMRHNRDVTYELSSLNVGNDPELEAEIKALQGRLQIIYDMGLLSLETLYTDAFDQSLLIPEIRSAPGYRYLTHRVANEIRQAVLLRYAQGNVPASNLQREVDRTTEIVFKRLSDEMQEINTRINITVDPAQDANQRFAAGGSIFAIPDGQALMGLVRALIEYKQVEWDRLDKDEAATERFVLGVKIKNTLLKIIKDLNTFPNIDALDSEADLFRKSLPSSIPGEEVQRIRVAVLKIRDACTANKKTLEELRASLQRILTKSHTVIYRRLIDQYLGPNHSGLNAQQLKDQSRRMVFGTLSSSSFGLAKEIVELSQKVDPHVQRHNSTAESLATLRASVRAMEEAIKKRREEEEAAKKKPTIAPETLAAIQQEARTYLAQHDTLVKKLNLDGKVSEGGQGALNVLRGDLEDVITHPSPSSTEESLRADANKLLNAYVDVFWNDDAVHLLLRDQLLKNEDIVTEFQDTLGRSSLLFGGQFVASVVNLLEQGQDRVIEVLNNMFAMKVTRALSVPRWMIQPAASNGRSVKELLNEDRERRTALLAQLRDGPLQLVRDQLTILARVRPNITLDLVKKVMSEELKIHEDGTPPATVPNIESTINFLELQHRLFADEKKLEEQIANAWNKIVDTLYDATVASHGHLLPWAANLDNSAVSVQGNPRLSGVCALETFCFLSDGPNISRGYAFPLAEAMLEEESRRREQILNKGLAAILEDSGSSNGFGDETQSFLSLWKEVRDEISKKRLPLSVLAASLLPIDFKLVNVQQLMQALEAVLSVRSSVRGADAASRRPRGDFNAWRSEMSILCRHARIVWIEAFLFARTEVTREYLLPQTAKGPQPVDVRITQAINSLSVYESVLARSDGTHLDLVREIADSLVDVDEGYSRYLKAAKRFMNTTGIKRFTSQATSVIPQLALASSSVKDSFARAMLNAFAAETIRLFVDSVQEALSAENPVDQRTDLSEHCVRHILSSLNILPPTPYNDLANGTDLFTAEDLQRYFAPLPEDWNRRDASGRTLVQFLTRIITGGSSRMLLTGSGSPTWRVFLNNPNGAETWARVTPKDLPPGQFSVPDPSSVNALTAVFEGNDTLHPEERYTLAYWLNIMVQNPANSRSKIRRAYPAILINGSLVLDFMQRLEELIGRNQLDEGRGRFTIRQLGVMREAFPIPMSPLSEVPPPSTPVAGRPQAEPRPELPPPVQQVTDNNTKRSPPRPEESNAELIKLLEQIRAGRFAINKNLESLVTLQSTYATNLQESIKDIMNDSNEATKRDITQYLAGLHTAFGRKSEQVREAGLKILAETLPFENLLVKIASGEDVRSDPAAELVPRIGTEYVPRITDVLEASSAKVSDIEKGLEKWIAAATAAIRKRFGPSELLKMARAIRKEGEDKMNKALQSITNS